MSIWENMHQDQENPSLGWHSLVLIKQLNVQLNVCFGYMLCIQLFDFTTMKSESEFFMVFGFQKRRLPWLKLLTKSVDVYSKRLCQVRTMKLMNMIKRQLKMVEISWIGWWMCTAPIVPKPWAKSRCKGDDNYYCTMDTPCDVILIDLNSNNFNNLIILIILYCPRLLAEANYFSQAKKSAKCKMQKKLSLR